MRETTVPVGDGFADLADARGVSPDELAAEAELVRREARRLARVHDSLLRRLGE
ncbi:hypothetical protein ACFT0G_09270 [Streptomyces sp. NPDC057020]|uniref:hypothetical protein n=1 Tax=unclassified Streptomyces TaxID=2593676 RepID=UPI00363F142D